MHRGQLRPRGTRHFRIVKSGNGQVIGHSQSHRARGRECGGGHVVVLRQDRRWRGIAAQEIERGIVAYGIGEIAGDDQVIVEDFAVGGKGAAIAFQSGEAGRVRRVTQDDAHAAVAHVQHV